MVELFQEFTGLLFGIGGILALGIIFEDKLIKLEDFIDEKIKEMREKENEKYFYSDHHLRK